MNTEEWRKKIKNLWEKERQSMEDKITTIERAWHRGYQAALEDLYIELEDEENATL